MKRNKYVYIGYRNLLAYSLEQEQAGGKPQNLDLRLCVSERGAYLLTYGGLDYAVSVERAEKFTADVLSKCTGKHRGFFPVNHPNEYINNQYAADAY